MLVLKGPSTLTTKLALNCLKYMQLQGENNIQE